MRATRWRINEGHPAGLADKCRRELGEQPERGQGGEEVDGAGRAVGGLGWGTDMGVAKVKNRGSTPTLGKTPAGRASRGHPKMKMAVRRMHQVQMMRSALFNASVVSSLAMDFFCSTRSP